MFMVKRVLSKVVAVWVFFYITSFNLYALEMGPDLGKPASKQLIKQWNADVFPDGKGLPKGQGAAVKGKTVYKTYCLSCHGVEGMGDSADELAGAMHSLTDKPPDKTIGSYWPYATTLFDFIRRAMPLNSPGILNADEIYAVTAYLLYLNGIIAVDTQLDANNLAGIDMPNMNGFINIYEKDKNADLSISH